jgi:hypothetical protein
MGCKTLSIPAATGIGFLFLFLKNKKIKIQTSLVRVLDDFLDDKKIHPRLVLELESNADFGLVYGGYLLGI